MKNVATVFIQGNLASRAQATKYCGKQGVSVYVSNGHIERPFNPDSPQLLYNLFRYPELNDVEYGWSLDPLNWLSMLLHFIMQWRYNMYGTACVPHNKLSMINIAGSEDVAQYILAIKACIKEYPQKQIVLFGSSRGGSTVLVALTCLSKEELAHIGMVIVEAPFASVTSVMYDTYPARLVPLLTWCLSRFTQYEEAQQSPLQAVASIEFPLETPLVFVTSEVDRIVPVSNTKQLITVLQERGHQSMHHIELKHSPHSKMSIHDAGDRQIYDAQLHGLYRKYLPQEV